MRNSQTSALHHAAVRVKQHPTFCQVDLKHCIKNGRAFCVSMKQTAMQASSNVTPALKEAGAMLCSLFESQTKPKAVIHRTDAYMQATAYYSHKLKATPLKCPAALKSP